MNKYLTTKQYLLMFLKEGVYTHKIPSVHFWASTLLIISALEYSNTYIRFDNGHILTPKDCFKEMNDCVSGDCFKNSCPIRLWLKQRRKYFERCGK